MSIKLNSTQIATLKINCHDPRGHHTFLQLSNDIQNWRMHIPDLSWWQFREKQCSSLFQQYGYDLQNGVWHCLIACRCNGWKGIANASMLLANGFAKKQTACWPPLSATGLRCQILENYCSELMPLIYALPVIGLKVLPLEQLLRANQMLLGHAEELRSPHQNEFKKMITWLDNNINTLSHNIITTTPASLALKESQQDIQEPKVSTVRLPWKIMWALVGTGNIILIMLALVHVNSPEVLTFSQEIWPNNPLINKWQENKKNTIDYKIKNSTELLTRQLKKLEQRLLDSEQKRKPYMTISELKTTVYELESTVRDQTSMVENQLDRLLIQQNMQQPISPREIHTLSSQLNTLENRLLLLEIDQSQHK